MKDTNFEKLAEKDGLKVHMVEHKMKKYLYLHCGDRFDVITLPELGIPEEDTITEIYVKGIENNI